MIEKISFIHCADLHLDSPFKGLHSVSPTLFKEIRNSTFCALDNLVKLAVEKQVDFILMVGDLFDQEQQSLIAQTRLRQAFDQLHKHEIQVYLSFGNHDYLDGRLFEYKYPENVHVFNQEQVTDFIYYKNDIPLVTISGFSYQNRAVDENKAREYPKRANTPYHIGMLHGSLHTNNDHDVYAPFQISDLVEKNYDYWALGHIHKREVLKQDPPIVYPGNIQGRSKKETGEKGVYYVELTEQEQTLKLYPVQTIRFEHEHLDVSVCKQPQELELFLDKYIAEKKQVYQRSIVALTLHSQTEYGEAWLQAGVLEELMDYFNDNNQEDSWLLISEMKLEHKVSWDRQELEQGHHFIGELLRSIDQTDKIENHLHPLLLHRQARKYLDKFTEEEQAEIKKEAEQLLLYHLLRD